MTNPSGKDQDIKAWNAGAVPAGGGAVLPSFDDMCFLFTSYATTVAEWKDRYCGATYATRLKAAIADMKFAIAEAEKHPEIAPPQTASAEAVVALDPEEMLKTARELRATSNGNCNAIAQAIMWECKAAAILALGAAQAQMGCGDPSCKDPDCTYGNGKPRCQNCGDPIAHGIYCDMCREMGCSVPSADQESV